MSRFCGSLRPVGVCNPDRNVCRLCRFTKRKRRGCKTRRATSIPRPASRMRRLSIRALSPASARSLRHASNIATGRMPRRAQRPFCRHTPSRFGRPSYARGAWLTAAKQLHQITRAGRPGSGLWHPRLCGGDAEDRHGTA